MAGYVSDAVIRRLPGYYRHLRELEAAGVTQISSQELGKRMQIRAIPKFKFVLDEGIAYSVRIADILNKLNLDGENQPDDE